jgi:prepilin-type N-terminal cleavage/methylation domain-containing protein
MIFEVENMMVRIQKRLKRRFSRRRADGFTLIELLVVIAVIALLLSVILPSLKKAKDHVKKVICVSNLKQQHLTWEMYAQDNDGKYVPGAFDGDTEATTWVTVLAPYYGEMLDSLICPSTDKDRDWQNSVFEHNAVWRFYKPLNYNGQDITIYGSYGLNSWIGCPKSDIGPENEKKIYRKKSRVKSPSQVPHLLDAFIWQQLVEPQYGPWVETEDWPNDGLGNGEMASFTLKRHGGKTTGCLFIDGSAVQVELKKLWTYRWYRGFDTSGDWTREDAEWPDWMK